MLIYNIFYFIPFVFWVLNSFSKTKILEDLYFYIIFIFYYIILATRYNIGGDWHAYESFFFSDFYQYNFFSIHNNFAYDLLVAAVRYFTENILFLNVIFSLIFICGISYFCYHQDDKIYAALISYFTIILHLGTGYIRQGLASSIFLIALILLCKNKKFLGYLFFFIAFMFHKTTILFTIIYFVSQIKIKNLIKTLLFLVFGIFFLYFAFYNYLFYMFKFYIGPDNYFISLGVFPRAFLAFVPSILIIFFINNKKKLLRYPNEFLFYRLSSVCTILIIPFAFLFSTFVDRLIVGNGLVFLLIYSLSNTHLYKNKYLKNFLKPSFLLVLILYFNIWLNLSEYSAYWLPYQNYFLENLY